MDDRYRHWQNRAGPGRAVFITTTCLDFNHAFRRAEMKTTMVRLLLEDCARYGARPQAWVVMSHHLHLLVLLPADKAVEWFVQRIKSNSAKALLPLLTEAEREGFAQQRGLNGRSFWKRSFRSYPVGTEVAFFRRVRYTHENPVKAGRCAHAENYRWSSASLFASGCWNWDEGLVIPEDYLEGL